MTDFVMHPDLDKASLDSINSDGLTGASVNEDGIIKTNATNEIAVKMK